MSDTVPYLENMTIEDVWGKIEVIINLLAPSWKQIQTLQYNIRSRREKAAIYIKMYYYIIYTYINRWRENPERPNELDVQKPYAAYLGKVIHRTRKDRSSWSCYPTKLPHAIDPIEQIDGRWCWQDEHIEEWLRASAIGIWQNNLDNPIDYSGWEVLFSPELHKDLSIQTLKRVEDGLVYIEVETHYFAMFGTFSWTDLKEYIITDILNKYKDAVIEMRRQMPFYYGIPLGSKQNEVLEDTLIPELDTTETKDTLIYRKSIIDNVIQTISDKSQEWWRKLRYLQLRVAIQERYIVLDRWGNDLFRYLIEDKDGYPISYLSEEDKTHYATTNPFYYRMNELYNPRWIHISLINWSDDNWDYEVIPYQEEHNGVVYWRKVNAPSRLIEGELWNGNTDYIYWNVPSEINVFDISLIPLDLEKPTRQTLEEIFMSHSLPEITQEEINNLGLGDQQDAYEDAIRRRDTEIEFYKAFDWFIANGNTNLIIHPNTRRYSPDSIDYYFLPFTEDWYWAEYGIAYYLRAYRNDYSKPIPVKNDILYPPAHIGQKWEDFTEIRKYASGEYSENHPSNLVLRYQDYVDMVEGNGFYQYYRDYIGSWWGVANLAYMEIYGDQNNFTYPISEEQWNENIIWGKKHKEDRYEDEINSITSGLISQMNNHRATYESKIKTAKDYEYLYPLQSSISMRDLYYNNMVKYSNEAIAARNSFISAFNQFHVIVSDIRIPMQELLLFPLNRRNLYAIGDSRYLIWNDEVSWIIVQYKEYWSDCDQWFEDHLGYCYNI